MDIIDSNNFNNFNGGPLVVAIGCFDGLHKGHQEIIKNAQKLAEEKNIKSGVYSFVPHPLQILKPDKAPERIINYRQKLKLLMNLDIDFFLKQRFTKKFSTIEFEEFVKEILINKLNIKYVVVGEDFRFGHKGKGNVKILKKLGKKYGLNVKVIKAVKLTGEIISSTKIRQLIKNGKIQNASEYLGRYFQIEGEVISGKGRGNKIGFPTANIVPETNYVLPPDGVYAVYVNYKKKRFKGITNLGFRPTFSEKDYSIETYIMGFSDKLYGSYLQIDFVNFIRPEKKFNNIKELKQQINKDILYTNNLLCYNI